MKLLRNIIVDGNVIPYYFADEDGNIYTEEKKLMKQHLTNNGYYRVKLSKGVKRGMYLVHRIIASTFIDNPNNMPIVNHLDNCRINNSVSNLDWADNSHNQKQRYKDGRHIGTKARQVMQIDKNTHEVIKVWTSPSYAEKELGICSKNICKVCWGQRKTAGGYIWKYV